MKSVNILFIITLLLSCGSKYNNPKSDNADFSKIIIGKWKKTGKGGPILEYKKNGEVIIKTMRSTVNYKYKVTGNDITITSKFGKEEASIIDYKDNTLYIKGSNSNRIDKFVRM